MGHSFCARHDSFFQSSQFYDEMPFELGLQMGKWRHTEAESFAQGHTAGHGWCWDSNPDSQTPLGWKIGHSPDFWNLRARRETKIIFPTFISERDT